MNVPNVKYKFLFASAPFSGVEVFLHNLRTIVERHEDIDATWLELEIRPPERFTRVPPFSQNWTLKGGTVMHNRIRDLVRSGPQFDAALFNHIIPPMFLLKFRRQVPIVVSLDVTPLLMAPYSQWYLDRPPRRNLFVRQIKERLVRSLYHDATKILPWSNLVFRSLQASYMVPASKMQIVPPSIDLRFWSLPGRRNGHDAQTSKRTNVLFVGADFERKGGDLLLEAAHRDDLTGCDIHIVTKSYCGCPPPNVFIHADLEPNSPGLVRLFRNADMFVLPTRADFSPYAVVEAMAMGLPVITTSVGALSELVHEGVNGFVIPSGNVSLLADRMKALCVDRELRHRMGDQGRTYAEGHHDLETSADTVISLMKRSADEKAAARRLS
jgi:glycosyltransferase involved in cell wall biosynthesis